MIRANGTVAEFNLMALSRPLNVGSAGNWLLPKLQLVGARSEGSRLTLLFTATALPFKYRIPSRPSIATATWVHWPTGIATGDSSACTYTADCGVMAHWGRPAPSEVVRKK